MKELKRIEGVSLCENFNKKFVDLISETEDIPELEKFLQYFEEDICRISSVDFFEFVDGVHSATCTFFVNTIDGDKYLFISISSFL